MATQHTDRSDVQRTERNAAQQVERRNILHREQVRSQTLLSEYFLNGLAVHVNHATHIKPVIDVDETDYPKIIVVLQNTGEIMYKRPRADFVPVPDLKGIAQMCLGEIGHQFLTIDGKVISTKDLFSERSPDSSSQLDKLDIIEISYFRRLYVLTNTGKVYSIKLDLEHHNVFIGKAIRHTFGTAPIVQLSGKFALDAEGKVYDIRRRHARQMKSEHLFTYILPNSNYLMTLKHLYFLGDRVWHGNNIVKVVKVDNEEHKFFLDKKGLVLTGPGEVIPNLRNIADIALYYNELYTIDINNKIQIVRWAKKYTYSVMGMTDERETKQVKKPIKKRYFVDEGENSEPDTDEFRYSDEEDEQAGCLWKFQSGPNAGKYCNSKVKRGSNLCKICVNKASWTQLF